MQRSADGLAGWATLDDAVATSDYTDTGLADATTYYYRVRAGDASSWGPWSGVVSDATDAPFSPSDIAGLVLWLDASLGTYQSTGGSAALADGDPVGEWQDQSGNGNDVTQVTGEKKPVLKTGANGLNGLPVLRFDGSSDLLAGSASASVKHWFVVSYYDLAAWDGFDGLLTGGGGGGNDDIVLIGAYTEGLTEWYNSASKLATSTCYRNGVSMAGTDLTGPMQEWALFSVAHATGWTITPQVGRDRAGGAYWDGDVAAVLGYSSVLSDADREAVEDYLMTRYGL